MIATTQEAENLTNRLIEISKTVKEDLENHYAPIRFEVFAEHTPIEFGELDDSSYIRFFIVFDGAMDDLRARRRSGEIGRVRELLSTFNISEFPVLSFVSKAEWEREKKRIERRTRR